MMSATTGSPIQPRARRAEGDAELDGGEEVVEVLLEAADGACSEDILGDELLDAGFADADESELGGDEEAVGEDEERDGDGAKEEEAGHWLGASGGRVSWGCVEWCEKRGFRHILMIIDRTAGLGIVYTFRYILEVELEFTWDEVKNKSNVAKHGVEFETARLVFDDPHVVIEQDREVDDEPRWQAIGRANENLVLLVAHVVLDSEDLIHIISARRAAPQERRRYEKNN